MRPVNVVARDLANLVLEEFGAREEEPTIVRLAMELKAALQTADILDALLDDEERTCLNQLRGKRPEPLL